MSVTIKCLITGGAGFIGSNLSESLLSKGYQVYCVDNFITGNSRNVENLLKNDRFFLFDQDITKPLGSKLINLLKGVKYIYHLASPASPPKYQKYSIETMLVNSLGTYNMLELAKMNNSFFLLASTSEIYGNPKEHPQKESYFGHVNSIGIRSCYDESKRFAESLCMEYYRKHGAKIRIARIFNTYGPKMEPDDGRVISNFINQAIKGKKLTIYGHGKQTRSFCYVSDMVSGLIKVIEKSGIDGEVFNMGNPVEKTVEEIGRIILYLMKKEKLGFMNMKLPSDDPEKRKPDISKAKKTLAWLPVVSLDEGLKKTIEYFKSL